MILDVRIEIKNEDTSWTAERIKSALNHYYNMQDIFTVTPLPQQEVMSRDEIHSLIIQAAGLINIPTPGYATIKIDSLVDFLANKIPKQEADKKYLGYKRKGACPEDCLKNCDDCDLYLPNQKPGVEEKKCEHPYRKYEQYCRICKEEIKPQPKPEAELPSLGEVTQFWCKGEDPLWKTISKLWETTQAILTYLEAKGRNENG